MEERLYQINPRAYIYESRGLGKSDQQIYNELTTRFVDKKAIAELIIGTPTLEDKTKYKWLNLLLLILLIISIIFKIIAGVNFASNEGGVLPFIFIIIFPLVNIYFAFGVANYLPSVYKIGGILSLISLIRVFLDFSKAPLIGSVDVLLIGSMAFLFFYLKESLFPNYFPKNLKTDSLGNYVMDTIK